MSLIGCCSVLNFRAKSTSQRHLCNATSQVKKFDWLFPGFKFSRVEIYQSETSRLRDVTSKEFFRSYLKRHLNEESETLITMTTKLEKTSKYRKFIVSNGVVWRVGFVGKKRFLCIRI